MNQFKVTFESTGYTQDKAILDATLSEHAALGFSETTKSEAGFPPGILAVVGGYITEDDGQDGREIKVFVSVSLLVEAVSESEAEALSPPEDLLTKVADMLGRDFTGNCALELEEHAWEVVDVDTVA